jgi:hypothetical protein
MRSVRLDIVNHLPGKLAHEELPRPTIVLPNSSATAGSG